VGLVQVTSGKDQDDYGANGVIDFVEPLPGKNATARTFTAGAANTFQLGGLTARILDTDYGHVAPSCTQDRVVRANLLLADPQGGNPGGSATVHHKQGQSHFYLAEIYPDTTAPAKAITRLHMPGDSKLMGFDVDDGIHHFRLIANPSTQDETYQDTVAWASAGGKIFAHPSGEQYRPAWIEDSGKESLARPAAPMAAVSGKVQIAIPAGTHVVLSDIE
jgi:hypothetical protein